MIRRPPRSTLFPYTSSSDLLPGNEPLGDRQLTELDVLLPHPEDRKSTRLNSSHSQISYAVFCLKKKNQKKVTHVRFQPAKIEILRIAHSTININTVRIPNTS